MDELLKAGDRRDFKPIDLGIELRGHMASKIRQIETRNVAGMIPGSDPKLKDEVVIFSAHWDHLGVATPVNGDAIYNGAVDNATGCAVLMELARAWAALPQKPRRSRAVPCRDGGGGRPAGLRILRDSIRWFRWPRPRSISTTTPCFPGDAPRTS